MDISELRGHFEAEYTRLLAVVPEDGDNGAIRVPSCPDWSLDDLVRHVGEVYLHKVDCIRLNARPARHPDLSGQSGLEVLERGFAAITDVFAVHNSADPAWTWFEPDQTVGFWVRRMAHETAVHRFDAELAMHSPTAIDADLAEDGLDELLTAMLITDIDPGEYPLGHPDIEVRSPGGAWFVNFQNEDGLRITADGNASTVIHGQAPELLLWLYNRTAGADLRFTGDLMGVGLVRDLMKIATQ